MVQTILALIAAWLADELEISSSKRTCKCKDLLVTESFVL